MYELNELRQLH